MSLNSTRASGVWYSCCKTMVVKVLFLDKICCHRASIPIPNAFPIQIQLFSSGHVLAGKADILSGCGYTNFIFFRNHDGVIVLLISRIFFYKLAKQCKSSNTHLQSLVICLDPFDFFVIYILDVPEHSIRSIFYNPRFIKLCGICCTMAIPHPNDPTLTATAGMWQTYMLGS